MLFIQNLDIQFATKHLFKNVSVRLHQGERVGLAGVNGAGKSTLLKIMAGLTETDRGVVTRAKDLTVGYLPQEITSFPQGRTLYQEAETAFAEILRSQRELEDISLRLAEALPGSEEVTALLKRQGELQHLIEQSDVFRMQAQIEKILEGLGFRRTDFDRDCREFSGGWLMRLMLAKLLLSRPSLLLLDEPTNHLDLESVGWLEEFLSSYPGALVVISHDRAFLDRVTRLTWELSLGVLTVYRGNYSKYLEEKENRLQVLRAAYDNQQAKIQQTMRFVERFRAKSTKASQVQSRLRQLEKMERIELEQTDTQISFRFPPAAPSGKLALEVTGLAKQYDGAPIFTGVDLQLQRGDKLAVVGVNGAGKSTLARILAGETSPDQGEVRLGHNVITSYFGQHQAQELHPGRTVFETVFQAAAAQTITQVRSLLGAFLFRGDEVDKKVRLLSGGEKSRLALARMIATPANLLIMDEPTNHLDMASQEVLQEALAQYDGTLVVVSHNRYFLDQFVNKVLEMKDGRATLHQGHVGDYLECLARRREQEQPLTNGAENRIGEGAAKGKGKEARRAQAQLRQEKSRLLAPHRAKCNRLEQEIELLEERKVKLEQVLASSDLYKDQDAFADHSREYKDVERRLERAYLQWETAQAMVEEIEAGFAGKE